MTVNLLDLLNSATGSTLAGAASQLLGESTTATKSSLGMLLPTVLGSIAQQGSTPQGVTSVLSTLNTPLVDANIVDNAASALGGGARTEALLAQGASLANSVFGDRAGAITDTLSSVGGITASSASKLLFIAAPVVMGFLKKHIATMGLDERGVRSLLATQAAALASRLDPRLASAAGLPVPVVAPVQEPEARLAPVVPVASAVPVMMAAASTRRSWWPWVAAAAAVVLGWWLLSSRSTTTAPVAATPAAAPADSNVSTSAAEIAPATPAAAFPMRIHFAVNSAALDDADAQSIRDAARAASEGGTKVDITGYTDKTGDATKNATLAKDRAVAVRDALIAAGVKTEQITMKPPAEITGSGDAAEARRVEITVSP